MTIRTRAECVECGTVYCDNLDVPHHPDDLVVDSFISKEQCPACQYEKEGIYEIGTD